MRSQALQEENDFLKNINDEGKEKESVDLKEEILKLRKENEDLKKKILEMGMQMSKSGSRYDFKLFH